MTLRASGEELPWLKATSSPLEQEDDPAGLRKAGRGWTPLCGWTCHSTARGFVIGLLLLLSLLAARPASAQEPRTLSEEAQISLLTILPGDALYSAYGHSAFRVHDPQQDIDWMFNYGTFDFTPFFAFEFAYGRLDYMLSVQSTRHAVPHYRAEGRPVIEQVLNLSPPQEQAIFRFLQINALPENRVYRYDFFFDNCSTRLRDVLAEVLGDDVQFDLDPPALFTFRELIDPYHGAFLDAGLDVLLGAPTDREATPWEMMFLPDFLLRAANESTIVVSETRQPLVARQDTLLWIDGYARDRDTLPLAAIAFWTLFLGWGSLTLWQLRNDRPAPRLPDVLLFATVGGAGLVMCFLWFVSLHEVTGPNWNLLWAWPTHAVAAALLARARGGLRMQRYMQVAAVVALVVAGAWWLWPQDLPDAVLPLVLLAALRAGWYGYVRPLQDATA